MTNAFSFGGVIAFWLGTSLILWFAHRLIQRRGGTYRLELARQVLDRVEEARKVFAQIRETRANPARRGVSMAWSNTPAGEEALKDDVRALLNVIELNSPFFDSIKELDRSLQKTFPLFDGHPLSDILQIRRDFWASAEIILVDDLQNLGPDFAESRFEDLRREAQLLLFGRSSMQADAEDAVDLRLNLALDDAKRLVETVDADLQTKAAKDRLPRPADFVVYPVRFFRAIPAAVRSVRQSVIESLSAARVLASSMNALAGSVKQSDTVSWSLNEVRRAREDLPLRFADAVKKAGGTARQGGRHLKQHYDFLLEARELQARYMEALQAAPDLSDISRQFIARLELAKKAEQMRLTSHGLLSRFRHLLVLAIARLISGLQRLQARLTPAESKQLAVVAAAPAARSAPSPSSENTEPLKLAAQPLPLPHLAKNKSAPEDAPIRDGESLREIAARGTDPLTENILPKDNLERIRALFHGRTRVSQKSHDDSARQDAATSSAEPGQKPSKPPRKAKSKTRPAKKETSAAKRTKKDAVDLGRVAEIKVDAANRADDAPRSTRWRAPFSRKSKQKPVQDADARIQDLLEGIAHLEDDLPPKHSASAKSAARDSLRSRLTALSGGDGAAELAPARAVRKEAEIIPPASGRSTEIGTGRKTTARTVEKGSTFFSFFRRHKAR